MGQLIAKNMATSTRDDLANEVRYAIDMFYSSYTPKYYNRHEGLYKTYQKHYKNSHGSTYYGGVIFSTKDMLPGNTPDGYDGTQEQVFNSFFHGFHGVPTLGIWTTPTPLQHTDEVFRMIIRTLPARSKWALNKALQESHWRW